MDGSITVIVALLLGLALGGLIAWLGMRSRVTAAAVRLEERDRVLAAAEDKFRGVFASLSQDALVRNNQVFLDLAAQKLEPVSRSLELVQERLQQIEGERKESYGALRQAVNGMVTTQQQLQEETGILVKALRQPQVRGRWGEVQLRRVVELSGMQEHCDFVEQKTVDAEGGRLRPDLLVQLPGGKLIVVDSKAPLNAYLDALDAKDDATRDAALDRHAQQVRQHISQLSEKAYWEQFEESPEVVVLFLPGEVFFSAAVQRDPQLIDYGFQQRVILASPTTLMSLLKAAYYGWQQERVSESAREVSELGRQLYDRIRSMADHFGGVGSHLAKAVEQYNQAIGSLEARVLVSARRFREMEAATPADIAQLQPVEVAPRRLPEEMAPPVAPAQPKGATSE
jgi:DNA recombination protein RmuC